MGPYVSLGSVQPPDGLVVLTEQTFDVDIDGRSILLDLPFLKKLLSGDQIQVVGSEMLDHLSPLHHFLELLLHADGFLVIGGLRPEVLVSIFQQTTSFPPVAVPLDEYSGNFSSPGNLIVGKLNARKGLRLKIEPKQKKLFKLDKLDRSPYMGKTTLDRIYCTLTYFITTHIYWLHYILLWFTRLKI